MPKYKPLYSLYKGLRENKYDVPDSYVSFQKTLTQPGNAGAKSRRGLYQSLKDSNYDVSDTYEDFYKNLFVPVNSTTSRALKIGENPNTPTVNRYRQKMFNSVDPTKNKASELTRKAVKTAHKAMDNVRKPVRGAVVNKQGKKVKEFDITPAKTIDDLNREYAQEVTSDWEKEQQRQSLYNTTRSLDEVQRKIAERDAQLDEADNGFWTGIRHAAQGMNVTGGIFQQYDDDMRKELIDPKYKQYLVEANYLTQMKKQLIQEEEDAAAPNATKWDKFKHASSSFTSGMLDEAFGSDAFDFGGYNKMRESDVLLRINDRINRGVATDDDRRLLQILKDKEEVESRLDNDAYSFGRGASQSAGFVTDFLITGGGDFGGLGRLGGKMALGLARKTFAKTMTKDLGKRFAAWSLKNLGKTLGEATGAAMTATSVQVGKTAANATQRYLGLDSDDGGLEYDKEGNLRFKGGTDVGTAIAKAVASGTIENYTELLGPHITSMGKRLFGWAGVGLEKITPDALSRFFDKVGSSELFKRIGTFTDEIANSKVLNAGKKSLAKVGVNDMPEEGLEEEAGIILNSLITGDNKFSDLWDKETQYKTWGGVMSMMGAMRAIPIARSAVGTAYSASKNKVEYFKCKHDLTKAETLARQALGDKWTPIKELIDNADNKHIIEVGVNIIRQSDKYSQEQAKAAQMYIGQLLKMRGFNNATMASIRDKNAKGEEQTDADKKDIEVSNAYAEGHEAEGELRHLIQLEYEKRTANLAKRLGLTPEKIEAMNVDSFSSYIGLNSDADFDIFQYKKAKAAYDGVMDNAQNLVDIAGEVAAHRVDNMTNVHDGTIMKAFKKGTESNPDSPVYIISGNIELNDDGSINYTDSDKMIVVYDEETGQREAIGNFMLASVDPNMQNAEEVKAQAIQEAKQKIITEQSNVIDGILAEGSEFTIESNDGSSHNYKIVQVDVQGNCIVSVDGTIMPEPLSLDAIQRQYDQSNIARSVKNDQTAQESEQTTQEPEQIQQEYQPIEDKFDYAKITNVNDGKVKSVVVTDEEGNNRFPNAKAVFLIQDKGAMPKFVVMDEEGNLTSYVGKRSDKIHLMGEKTVDEYKKQRQEELQMIAAENANSSMIEDNSGAIEADRGGIEVEDNTQPLSEADADNVIAQMESSAETAPELELTPDNWVVEFGEDGIVSTPIGDVKMGENQVAKLFEKGRSKEFGMIKPTLTNPDVIIEVPSHSADGNEERSSSYLFIKTFLGKNGEKVYYFKSVTIKKDGLEISISSHYDRAKRVKEALMKGKLLYRKNDGAQTEQNQPSASVTTSQEDAAGSSENKDTNISANGNENNESLTFEDGTPIPIDANGETDLSQTDAAHAAEWYDNNLGEDADDWLDGEIKKAKKVLEQAKNKKLTGTKPSELVASKKEKEAAIADAQAHYDSAISIRDSLKERRIAKEENTTEGRKELIEKARRKFSRLKSAVKDDAEAVSQLYKDVVGSLLHRLYDVTGIDVTDTIPLTAEEYVASNLGAHSLNYEGTETSKGVKQETGLSREDFAKTQLLAADGKGTTIDNLVHSLWENRPSNLESLDTQDIRNALIGVLNSGFRASEARNYIENLRIAQAENILEEQKKAAANAAFAEEQTAPAEEQTETAPESEEKTGENNSDEINDEENEQTNAPEQKKFPDKLREGSKTIEVPEDATDENPLGAQRDQTDLPFSARDNGTQQTTSERAADVEKNKVDDIGLVDAVIGEKIRKSFERIAKMMGAKIQYQRTDKLGNGWIQETTDADGNVHRTIFITLDSSITEGAQFIFGHEMTHQIKSLNPAAYNELTQLVLDTYGSDAFDKAIDETMKRYSDAGFSGRARDYYADEVVADAVGEMIRDLNLAHTLAMKMSHPLLAAIHEILQKIKLAFYGTEYNDVTKNIIRSIEQAYVKTANGQVTNSETGEDVSFSLRQKPEPKKKGVGYKVFVLKDGKLYPPMVANPDGAATPVGVWLDADAAPIAGESKTGRPQVKQGGKGTQGGSGKLAYRPGWHLGVVPYAIQFNRKDAEGNKTLFPKNFVFAEVEYAADVDYQEEARQEGINPSGKYQHSLAGLKHLPTDGYYMYRTNPNPETDPWVITGAMKVNRILTRAEQAELVKNAGREPQQIQEGDIVTDDVVNSINQEIAAAPKFSLKVYHGSGADFTEFDFDHMGEGAGSQAFGWGGYVTTSKKIGKSYATLMDNDPSKAYYRIQRSNGTRFAKKYPTLESFLHGDKQIAMNDKFTEQEKIDYYNEMKKLAEPYHNLYEVDIPEDNGSNYLDWDALITDELIDKVAKSLPSLRSFDIKDLKKDRTFDNFYKTISMRSVTDDASFNDDKAASKLLSSLGYTGIKYKAGRNFGGAEEGDTNYVIFKPEDMRITEHTKFSLKDIKPVGKNKFGDVYDQFKGKPKEAFDFLLKNKDGYLKGVFHRDEIGDIDLGYGLAHIIRKHVELMNDFDSVDDAVNAIIDVISNGKVEPINKDRVYEINKDIYRVAIAKDENGNWVLSAMDKSRSKKQKLRDKSKKGAATVVPPSLPSDGAGAVAPNLSAAKIDNSSETAKENGEKFSLKDEKTMFGMHNISIDKLRKAIKQGGFAAPSMGVVDSKNGIYSDYGEITLIPKAEKLAKRTGKNAGTFTADAWTPTYPQVERIMNKQGEKVFNTDMNEKLGDVDNGIYSNIRESWKGYLSSGDVRDGLYWHYLFDKGMNPETIYQTGKYDNDITNEVMRISDNGSKTDYTDEEVAELIRLMNNATGKDNDVDAQREKLKARIASAEKQGNHLLAALKKKRLAELEGVENFYIAADFVNDVVRNNRKNGKVDVHDTMSVAKEKVENDKKLSADFPSWLDKKTEEYGVEEMLYNGTTPSGKPKYIPNTIDNAVKLMKKQGVAGGYTAFGSELGVFIAKNSPEVNTLAAMKNAKDKLIPFGDERHNQIKDKITKEFLELSDEIRVGSNNRYAFDDSGVSRMVELTDHKGNEKEYLKKAYNVEVSDEWMDRYNKLLDTIKKDYKVFYFETKFMRPYGLDEFEKAIVPSDTPSDVVDALTKAGIDVSSYERGNAEDRQKVTMDAINSSDNIRFSLAGERGAAAADKAEERTTRMDFLSVARKMEEEKKDAKAIKIATGWERGADGKWRFEIPDFHFNYEKWKDNNKELLDSMDDKDYRNIMRYEKEFYEDLSPIRKKNFDELRSRTGYKIKQELTLGDVLEGKGADTLFKYYPELRDVKFKFSNLGAATVGIYDSKTKTIEVNDALLYSPRKAERNLQHEVQHVIQHLEGFAKGGNEFQVRGEVKKKFSEVIKQIRQLRAEGKEDEAKAIVEKNRGLYNAYQANDDYNSYKSLAGEVEARNVQERMNMTPEERRKTLAESTEDVARKDQIFLGVGDVSFSLRGSTPYDKQMEEWKEKNHLDKDAAPMEKPIKQDNENIFDYMNRMVEWTRNQNLWKTAPKQTGFQDALDKWKADNGLSPDAYPPVRPHRENYSTEIGYTEDLEEYNKKKELWKSAPKPKDFDLSVDLEDMNKQLRNIRRAVLNQKNYDQRTIKAVSDLVRKMLNIGWGDGLSRGKVGNLLSAAKNATGANDVKKYLDKAMGILAENYLNRLSTAYDNLINTKGARADQSGVIKMGSLDASGQAFMSEYKKAINMDDKSLNNYVANIEEDSAKNEDNVEMNDYRLAGIQAAIMYKQQIGGNDADIAELKRQIGELKNKKDATKEDKDLLKSLEKKLFENKFDRITMYENLLNNIQRMVKESKGRAKEFREEITEHKNEILHRANLDLEGVDSTYYDTTTAKKKFVNNDLQRAVFSSTYTFEQFLKFFGKHSANGEGRLYNYFHKLNQDALDEEQLYNEMNRNALDEKTKELFGKKKFMKLVGIDGKGMKEMDVEVTDYSNKKTGKRTIHLKQGQMLYIYLVNKETDGEMKLRAMGITEEDVAAIEENLDPRVKAMGEWLQDEYLPECQRRYQATHTKYFGAPMKEVENYFPLAINNRARNVKEDVNQDSDAMSQLAGTSTGAIVTRRVNVIPIDIENADAFEVAFNHLQEMEEWSAMLPFRQDINTLLSYTHFRNQVQNMSSVAYGSGKTLWNEFKQTAQIAAGTYKPKVNAGMMDSRIAAAMGGIAVAKISGRLWTAIKQSQSATVFLPECDFIRFVKNGVNPYGSWKWAKENIPDFRKRIENITYGDVKLRQYLDELEKYHDWTKVISKWGMAPNILVDGITCAVGARSVYETEVNRLTKLGYPKEKAEEKAYYKAVAAYNKTQQSSGGMYLSPMQVDRTYASAALSLFKNANYAYGRMQIEACRGLARTYDFWGGKHKTTLIESMTRQIMEEDGLDENTARAIAKATYNRTFRQSIGRLINFATLVPVSWALYKVLPYLLTGDDDDKKKDMIEEAVLKGFATSLSDNYVIPFASNILNAGLKVEDGKPTFDPEVFRYQNLYINPATSDLANIYSMIGNQKWYSVCNKVGMLGVQTLIGFNPETVGALYQAFAEADSDNGNTAKEWQIGILKAISAPEESIRELYMDELGLKSGDIKKIPLAELEKRYAERQINRDNLLSQIGMDAETFNGYVEKYQKSFEKKIKDKMDKWDEYDKKKADEFFDTTSDPKLKDMIAKKRANDANAAADEQIAKEGLNQEKKGKEPSEEAYDAVKMSIDVAEDNAISTYNKVLNKRYAAMNDEYNNQTDAMKYIFMSKHPNFKAYNDLKSEYTTYGKKMKELKEKLVSADGYDAKQAILKQIRAERDKFYELQSKVR